MAYTVGEFANALSGVSQTLNGIAEQLKLCDQVAQIGTTVGRSPICQGPIIAGAACMLSIKDPFIVADLVETVEGIRDWVLDVESKLQLFSKETALDYGPEWPARSIDAESA